MEAAVLLGLVGVGYLFNQKNEDNNPINNSVNKDISTPNGENLYNSNFYNETDNMVRNLASTNFESSLSEGSNIINHMKLDKDMNKSLNQQMEEASMNEIKEGFDNYTYSNATGGYIPQNEFLSNDQGVQMQPFFSRSPSSVNYDDPRRLRALQGGNRNEFYQSKLEVLLIVLLDMMLLICTLSYTIKIYCYLLKSALNTNQLQILNFLDIHHF